MVKKFLLVMLMVAGAVGAWAEQSQKEMKELLINSYSYMAKGSFVIDDITEGCGDNITKWGKNGKFLLYNGACLWDAVRSNNRLGRTLTAAPPKFGSWWWQSEANTPNEAVKNSIIFLKSSSGSWLTTVYNMTLTKRLDSAEYTLAETSFNGVDCYVLTAKYPKLKNAADGVPFNHIFLFDEVQQFFDAQFKSAKTAEILTEDEWFFPAGFIAENITALRKGYYAAISLTIDKNSTAPAIYRIMYFNEKGTLIDDRRFGKVTAMKKPSGVFQTVEVADVAVSDSENFGSDYATYHKPQVDEPKSVTFSRYIKYLYVLLAVAGVIFLILLIVKMAKKAK